MDIRKTRSTAIGQKNVLGQINNFKNVGPLKRKEVDQRPDEPAKKKRVFGDITNKENAKQNNVKKAFKKSQVTKSKKAKPVLIVPKQSLIPKPDIVSSQPEKTEDLSWEVIELSQSQEFSQSQESNKSSFGSQSSNSSELSVDQDVLSQNLKNEALSQNSPIAPEIDDIDKESLGDVFQVANYAKEIFKYYKERESKFVIEDYISKQDDLNSNMRAILVDWLVEVQENFELNHETLYLAIKVVDLFLCKEKISRDKLQLVGATSLFIACKFDERVPPVLDDFLYICDDAYRQDQLISMEMKILKSLDFDLGIPLSYRFLRRYAKCARVNMETLTLARYILEYSQMEYKFVKERDSLCASAALLLAMKMKGTGQWNVNLEYHTGYTLREVLPFVKEYNTMISAPPSKQLHTIRTKYSHSVFHQVAKTPALTIMQMEDLERSCS